MAQVLNIENYQAANRHFISLGIPDEPYSKFNYIDLIEKLKKKDVELVELRKMVNGAKYEQMRRDMERKALEGDPRLARRHSQELRIGPYVEPKISIFGNEFDTDEEDNHKTGGDGGGDDDDDESQKQYPPKIIISGFKPPSTIGLAVTEMHLPNGWCKRDVIVKSYNIATQEYLISTSKASFILCDASEYLLGDKSIGIEIELEASCDLIFQSNVTIPIVRLKYIHHITHYKQDDNLTVNNVSGRVSLLMHRYHPLTKQIQFYIVQDKRDDYINFKYVLRSYLVQVTTFPQFAPNKERKRIRHLINSMRDQLLDEKRWNLKIWSYDKLMIAYEGQGWSLNNLPFTVKDGEMLMNLNQEATKAMEMIGSMARKELEKRLIAKDTKKLQELRKRWTLPMNYVDNAVRPYEIETSVMQKRHQSTKQIDINMESIEQAVKRTMKEYVPSSTQYQKKKLKVIETLSYNEQINLSQTSYVCLLPMLFKDTIETTIKETMPTDHCSSAMTSTTIDKELLVGNTSYTCGKWMNGSNILNNLHRNNFNLMLEITSKSEFYQLYDIIQEDHRKLLIHTSLKLPSSPTTRSTNAAEENTDEMKYVAQQKQLKTPARNRNNSNKDYEHGDEDDDEEEYASTPLTKLKVPKGGWLYSESKRRIGPGTNDPKLPATASQRKQINDAKMKRKRQRKKALRKKRKQQRHLNLARSKSMNDGAFLPKL